MAAAAPDVFGYTTTTFAGLLTSTAFPALQPASPTTGFAGFGADTTGL